MNPGITIVLQEAAMHMERREGAVTRTQGRITLAACLAAALVTGVVVPAAAQKRPRVDPVEPCCQITSINGAAGTATAKDNATGQVLTFAVTDKALLQSLRIGEPIYFNARTRQVGVSYGQPCCDVVSMSVPSGVSGAASTDGITSTPLPILPPNDLRTVAGISAVNPIDPCCQIVANSALNSHMGRIVVSFPAGADAGMTVTNVMRGNEKVDGWMGSGQLLVPPGRYTVVIANQPVTGVVVEGAHDTQVKVGAVRVGGVGNTSVDLLSADGKTRLDGGMGKLTVGVPVGTYAVRIGGVTQKVSVAAGKITEF